MQKRRNDVKARTTLLLALPDEHQLRFSKYKTVQELWAAILKTFGGNEATKKTKKNQLKQQYGNFKAEGSETLEQTFNILQAIVSHLEFMDVEIEQDDLNQKFQTSLAPEWLMYTIVWRNKSDLDTMSLDDVYNHLKVYEPEVQNKSESNPHNMAFISSAKNNNRNREVNTASIPTASTQVSSASANVAAPSISLDTACAYIASQSSGSQIKYKDINQIDEDDIKEMSKVECFNCHKMCHFARKCRAPRSQERGRRENYRQGSKEEEHAPKDLMAIDGVGWDWSFMENEGEDHALVADGEAPDRYNAVPPPAADLYLSPKKDLSWTGLPEFMDDTVTDYSRTSSTVASTSAEGQNKDSSTFEDVASPNPPKPFVKRRVQRETTRSQNHTYKSPSHRSGGHRPHGAPMRPPLRSSGHRPHRGSMRPSHRPAGHRPHGHSMNPRRPNMNCARPNRSFFIQAPSYETRPFLKSSAGSSQNNINDKGYWDSGCSRHMTGNISYLSDFEPLDGGYLSFGQGGCKITCKGTIKT
nr:hypothetical protein [Tanacetum cinerariifolium]